MLLFGFKDTETTAERGCCMFVLFCEKQIPEVMSKMSNMIKRPVIYSKFKKGAAQLAPPGDY